jgi:two-component system OmpR family response regulator
MAWSVHDAMGGTMASRILVVDDEPAVNDLICDALHLAGFEACSAEHGMQALRILREQRIDLAIIDVNMPIMSGYDLLERMRASGFSTPVIVLTARQEREDPRTSFGLGADDFVRKPFGIEELTLRVAAILRRTSAEADRARTVVGAITIDDDAHQVRRGDEVIELSPTEYRLLSTLVAGVGRVLTREQLLEQVWGLGPGMESTALETYVSYLRRKLGDEVTIRTVRGVGYQLLDPRT